MIALFFSCSPAYKTSQTPDDVYYSPGQKYDVADRYETYASPDDDYLRMKVQNHDKWSSIDDYDYWYDSRYYANNMYSPYTSAISVGVGVGYGFGYGAYSPYYAYNPYWYNPWNSWYAPHYTVVYYKNPSVYYKPLRYNSNLSTYSNRNYNNYNMPMQSGSRSNMYNNSNSNRTKNSYYNQNQYNNSNPVRTFNNSGNMSSGGGSRISGGGGRVRP